MFWLNLEKSEVLKTKTCLEFRPNPNRKRKRLTTKEEDHDAASMAAMNAMMGGGWGNFNLGADEEDKVDSIAQDSKGERPNEKTDLSD